MKVCKAEFGKETGSPLEEECLRLGILETIGMMNDCMYICSQVVGISS